MKLEQTIQHPLQGNISSCQIDETEALLILSSMPLLGPIKIRLLVRHFGSSLAALLASPHEISQLPGFGEKISYSWEKWPTDTTWKRNLLLVAQHQAHLIAYTSPHYPKRLLKLPDAPILLYVKGNLIPADQRSIAIVGTRQASIYGNEMAKKFANDLAALGFTVVSGLARGIDTAAHSGALERGRSIAIIGSGLADIYPTENRALAERLASQGAVISEFPMATPPDRQNFPQRNRIVSGMTQGTLLIEAPVKSGAMITMQRAEEQGRHLFTIPGRLDHDNFRGNHALLKKGQAQLVECGADIANVFDDFFGSLSASSTESQERKPSIPLDKEEKILIESLPYQELSIEQIVEQTKIPISGLNVLLMKLVLKGHLKEFPGKVYKRSR
jgi:DNA processing protein